METTPSPRSPPKPAEPVSFPAPWLPFAYFTLRGQVSWGLGGDGDTGRPGQVRCRPRKRTEKGSGHLPLRSSRHWVRGNLGQLLRPSCPLPATPGRGSAGQDGSDCAVLGMASAPAKAATWPSPSGLLSSVPGSCDFQSRALRRPASPSAPATRWQRVGAGRGGLTRSTPCLSGFAPEPASVQDGNQKQCILGWKAAAPTAGHDKDLINGSESHPSWRGARPFSSRGAK